MYEIFEVLLTVENVGYKIENIKKTRLGECLFKISIGRPSNPIIRHPNRKRGYEWDASVRPFRYFDLSTLLRPLTNPSLKKVEVQRSKYRMFNFFWLRKFFQELTQTFLQK